MRNSPTTSCQITSHQRRLPCRTTSLVFSTSKIKLARSGRSTRAFYANRVFTRFPNPRPQRNVIWSVYSNSMWTCKCTMRRIGWNHCVHRRRLALHLNTLTSRKNPINTSITYVRAHPMNVNDGSMVFEWFNMECSCTKTINAWKRSLSEVQKT